MPGFTRVWRLLERKFPPSGPSVVTPSEVSDDVALVHDILKPGFSLAEVRLISFFNSSATGGATTILNAHLNPPRGTWLFPVLLNVRYDGAANIVVESRIARITGAETDPWGDWLPTLAAGAFSQIGHVRASASLAIHAPMIPCPNNNQHELRFVGPAAATNVFTDFYGVLIPGELISVEMWRAIHTNMAWTVALP